MTTLEIIRKHIEADPRLDGLVNDGRSECCCLADNLGRCGDDMGECKTGHRIKGCLYACEEVHCTCYEQDWHIVPGQRPDAKDSEG